MAEFLPANLVLEDTVERIYHKNAYAENWHGLFLIRGENVVLLGEVVRPPDHRLETVGLIPLLPGPRSRG